jgi:hypothetical protein
MEIIHGRTDRHQFWIVVENDVYGQERETAFAEEDEARAYADAVCEGDHRRAADLEDDALAIIRAGEHMRYLHGEDWPLGPHQKRRHELCRPHGAPRST